MSFVNEAKDFFSNIYSKVHAIYEPDGYGPFGQYYSAAADLFEEDLTFRVYFDRDDLGNIKIKHVERWFIG